LSAWKISCKEECRDRISALELSETEWESFEKDNLFWRAIIGEIEERDKFIMERLRYGDEEWSDAIMRARINELEFVKQIPKSVILDLAIARKANEKKGE
jgi:hypothetical protein